MSAALPLSIAHRVDRSLSALDTRAPRWPAPDSPHAALVLRSNGPCPLRTARFSHRAWSVRLESPTFQTTIPLEALHAMAESDHIDFELEDTCGSRLYGGEIPVP